MKKTKFVAEVSSNHNGSLARSIEFIKAAADSGCDAVKFQLFKIDELFAPEILQASKQHRDRKAWELPLKFVPELARVSHDLGLEFSCTPFYIDAVKELQPYVDFYKLASYELLWHDLAVTCANTGLPLVLSTGMAMPEEITDTLSSIKGLPSKDVTVLRCTSSYPTPPSEANLQSLETLGNLLTQFKSHFNLAIGWSDHTVSPAVILRSVFTYGASFVEFHLDLDGDGEEFKAGHCWLPEQISPVIEMVKEGLLAEGNGRIEPVPSELSDRLWRADPEDGLRPFKQVRKGFRG
jgi:sialic acid synthase SpsE